MRRSCTLYFLITHSILAGAQGRIDSMKMYGDVRITIDRPAGMKHKTTTLVIYALPNGNTTEQTMGKKMESGDDWHFDIQHIRAQTIFLREKLRQNIIVAYLENNYKSWPSWKQRHHDFKNKIAHIVDTLKATTNAGSVYLNGHSGGGSFIFGFIDAFDNIPSYIQRIGFLDSNYGYDSVYYPKFYNWLTNNKKAVLTVFAYNDSVALYNNKPVVSAKGGTWYKSRFMLSQLRKDFDIAERRNDSLVFHWDKKKRIGFFFKTNPEQKIFHTHQVELNGFIHSILFGTKKENDGYRYFDKRAYQEFIH